MAMNNRIRRKKSKPNVISEKIQAGIEKLAIDTEDLMAQAQEIQNQIQDNLNKMLQHLNDFDQESVSAVYGIFEKVIPPGRGHTEIRNEDLYDKLELPDFLDCVSASVTKVRQHLSEKELNDISKFHPGKPGKPTIKYKPKKK